MNNILVERRRLKGKVLHDFPYPSPRRKCPHSSLISLTLSGACIFSCPICYARAYPWSVSVVAPQEKVVIYDNLLDKLKEELNEVSIVFPIYLSQVTDPLQPIPEIRNLTFEIIKILIRERISFGIVTKSADGPRELLKKIPTLIGYPYWFLTLTVENTPTKQIITSPYASPILARFETIRYFNDLGIPCVARIDPTILGLVREEDLLWLINQAQKSGSKHIIASLGYFNKVSIKRVLARIAGSQFKNCLKSVKRFYQFDEDRVSTYPDRHRFMVPRPLRVKFHIWLRKKVEDLKMTYAVCQELPKEFDSPNIPSCEGRNNIFVHKKNAAGKFEPINCHGDCLRSCPNQNDPSCGNKDFLSEYPYRYQSLVENRIRGKS